MSSRTIAISAILACVFAPQELFGQERFLNSVAALAIPGSSRAFLVQPNQLFNGEWRLEIWLSPSPDSAKVAQASIFFEPDRVPVARWSLEEDGIDWATSVAVLPEPAPLDTVLIASVQVTARNHNNHPRHVSVAFALGLPEPSRAFTAFDAGHLSHKGRPDTLANGWAESVDSTGGIYRATLAAHQSKDFRVLIPSLPYSRRRLTDLSTKAHPSFIAEARRLWRGYWQRGMILDLKDARVEAAYRDALTVLLSVTERRGDVWLPIGGPFHYRDVWLRDGARAIYALAVSGHTNLSRHLASGLLTYQYPPGFFMSQRGQMDGTGHALWALEQSYLRGDQQHVPPNVLHAALQAWRWYERQRERGRHFTACAPGMLPLANPKDNELVRGQLVGSDFWALAGYRATARLCSLSGRHVQTDSVNASLRGYQGAILANLAASESPDVPASWQGGGHDWGNLNSVFPCQALSPLEPRVERLARRVWAVAGGAGLCAYGNPDSLHYYLGSDLAIWALLAHQTNSADSVLEAMLYWRTSTGGAPEMFSRSRHDFGTNLPPHATSASALVGYIRNAIICDMDDTLRLTLGARPAWWQSGSSVLNAPTRWGNIDIRFKLKGSRASWKWTPVSAWTELTLPVGWEAVPRNRSVAPLRSVMVAPGTSELKLRVRRRS